MRSISAVRRFATGVTRLQPGAIRSLSSRVNCTGIDIIDPTIGLNEDQRTFYDLARSFADEKLAPFASQWDEESHFPLDVLKEVASLGFAGLNVRDDVGGSGLSRVDSAVIIEALATGCVGTTAMLTIHNMCAGMIDKFGSEEQRQEYLPKLCNLDLMASYCLTEPGSGSDAAGLATRAILDETTNEYVLDGSKAFISGAGMSDLYLVMCRTGGPGPSGISCILIPKNAPGLSFGADEKKMGWKVQPTRQVIFEGVRVPAANRLGSVGAGFSMAMAGLDGGRLSIASCSLGAAQKCFEKSLAYCKDRKQFGKPISANQVTQFKFADMARKVNLSRLAIRSAASLMDEGHPAATSHCALAKLTATDLGFEVCNEALQLHGGYGYLRDYEMERFVRDVRVNRILEGTNEIMHHIVGRAITA